MRFGTAIAPWSNVTRMMLLENPFSCEKRFFFAVAERSWTGNSSGCTGLLKVSPAGLEFAGEVHRSCEIPQINDGIC